MSPDSLETTEYDNRSLEFINPLVEQRADPWVYKEEDTYYFIATAPEFDRIVMRSSKTLNGLKTAPEKVIWKKHTAGIMGAHIWAPELHKVDGKWYIYFAAGEAENVWAIRMYALSNDSANPLKGEWTEEGQVDSGWQSFALDATHFQHQGKHYMIWAQSPPDDSFRGTALWMSQMSSPTKLTGPVIRLTKPELDWETVGHNVNEGAAVLIKNDKVFVTYSASATDHNYAMGLLWADIDADLMDVKSWHKSPQPVFYTNAKLKRFGPGHNSFTLAEDGKTDLLIYHARDYQKLIGNPLTDPNRHTRVRVIHWDKNGFPVFGQEMDD
ncbi:family 43 glycosylhydrolase [Catenovulum sp. 2E275]|uniref:glycoside hydrolase family 43 protein n=1 Tax=Catenovulum sp. 2E275 TaxID=2980497 RepID=UPI0021D0FC4F|nr:family 43 glycosylhydrolase [Catenovulum sp. 2E275]MCU4677200.1 family 43 glycosylhydrolase [Catenovulum sp. 2E275]